MLTEYIQDFVHITTLLATGVEFTVRIGSCTSFAKTVIAFRVYLVLTTNLSDIYFSLADILASLYHNGAKAKFYQSEGSKQTTRTGTYNDDLRLSLYIIINSAGELLVLWKFIDVKAYFQVDKNRALARIDASLQYTDCLDGACINSFVLTDEQLDVLFIGCLFGQNSDLVFLYHMGLSE